MSEEELNAVLKSHGKKMKIGKLMFVLPAFRNSESFRNNVNDIQIPKNKKELLKMIEKGITEPFAHEKSIFHKPVNIQYWMKTNDIYSILYHGGFEPYILTYRSGLPSFWNGFIGYAYNKQSWI